MIYQSTVARLSLGRAGEGSGLREVRHAANGMTCERAAASAEQQRLPGIECRALDAEALALAGCPPAGYFGR